MDMGLLPLPTCFAFPNAVACVEGPPDAHGSYAISTSTGTEYICYKWIARCCQGSVWHAAVNRGGRWQQFVIKRMPKRGLSGALFSAECGTQEIHLLEMLRDAVPLDPSTGGTRLEHPNLTYATEILESAECLYIVLPYAGKDLLTFIQEHNGLSGLQCESIFVQALSGLHYLHEALQIVSLDLACENILLESSYSYFSNLDARTVVASPLAADVHSVPLVMAPATHNVALPEERVSAILAAGRNTVLAPTMGHEAPEHASMADALRVGEDMYAHVKLPDGSLTYPLHMLSQPVAISTRERSDLVEGYYLSGTVVRLIDFGASLALAPVHAGGVAAADGSLPIPFRGRCRYAPPEMQHAKLWGRWEEWVDLRKCDVFSLGAVLFTLCAGDYFMEHWMESDGRGWVREAMRGPEALKRAMMERLRHVPEGMVDVIVSMMHKNWRERPTLAEVANKPWVVGAIARHRCAPYTDAANGHIVAAAAAAAATAAAAAAAANAAAATGATVGVGAASRTPTFTTATTAATTTTTTTTTGTTGAANAATA
jgi:serine/threonine protein kinase